MKRSHSARTAQLLPKAYWPPTPNVGSIPVSVARVINPAFQRKRPALPKTAPFSPMGIMPTPAMAHPSREAMISEVTASPVVCSICLVKMN